MADSAKFEEGGDTQAMKHYNFNFCRYLNLQVGFEFQYGFEHWYVASHCGTMNGGFTSCFGVNLCVCGCVCVCVCVCKKSYQ